MFFLIPAIWFDSYFSYLNTEADFNPEKPWIQFPISEGTIDVQEFEIIPIAGGLHISRQFIYEAIYFVALIWTYQY